MEKWKIYCHSPIKIFVKSTLVFSLVKTLLSRNFSLRSHCVEIAEILSHWKIFSSNNLFCDFFSKTIAFTTFLRKKCEREFLQFPHCGSVSVNFRNFYTLHRSLFEIVRQINSFIYSFICKNVVFTKFLQKKRKMWDSTIVNFVKATFLLKKLLKSWFDEIFSVRVQ